MFGLDVRCSGKELDVEVQQEIKLIICMKPALVPPHVTNGCRTLTRVLCAIEVCR